MNVKEYFAARAFNALASLALLLGMLAVIACSEPHAKATDPGIVQRDLAVAVKPDARPAEPAAPTQQPTGTTAAAGPGATQASSDLQPRLLKIFSGYEYVPTRDDLLRLADAPQLVPALWTLYGDTKAPLAARTQALVSLRFFPSDQTRGWLEQVLGDATTPDAVRRPAVKAYGHAFGAAAVPLVTQLLAHTDLHTRDSAARALGAIAVAASKVALEARLAVEPEPTVKATIAAQLARLNGTTGQP